MSRVGPRARPRISLKMQAIAFLSRREHSRQELRTKLLASLRKQAREDAALAAAARAAAEASAQALRDTPANGIDDAFAPRGTAEAPAPARTARRLDRDVAIVEPASPGAEAAETAEADPEATVDELLDWLVAQKYLSDTRFVESRVNARAARQGATMIRYELSQHGLALEPEQVAALRETEFARAQALWQRRFGEVAGDPRERMKQARFLVSRGFATGVVRKIVGGLDEE